MTAVINLAGNLYRKIIPASFMAYMLSTFLFLFCQNLKSTLYASTTLTSRPLVEFLSVSSLSPCSLWSWACPAWTPDGKNDNLIQKTVFFVLIRTPSPRHTLAVAVVMTGSNYIIIIMGWRSGESALLHQLGSIPGLFIYVFIYILIDWFIEFLFI